MQPKFFLPLITCLLCHLLTGCHNTHQSDIELHDKMMSAFGDYEQSIASRRQPYMTINLDSLTGFEWDNVYFFHNDSGYPTNEQIEEIIGTRFYGNARDETCLLFVKHNKVVKRVDFNQTDNVWFYGGDSIPNIGYYDRYKNGSFIFEPNCKYQRVYYLTPISNINNVKKSITEGEFYKPCY